MTFILTYDLIPEVGTKVVFPEFRDIGISYTRMLLHDTMLKYDSHRTGTSDTPQCDCGMAAETAEHFLLHCCKYYKNSSGDEIANVLVNDDIAHT